MSKVRNTPKNSADKGRLPLSDDRDSHLDEYKLAIQVQQGYYDLVFKCITAFLTITALSLGFIFRETISDRLKVIFCWFNLIMSVFFVIGFTGFCLISKRVSRRMDRLASALSFELGHHHALNYGIFFTLLSGIGVLLFWIAVLIFRWWARI
jgi:hypothetical protein